MGDAIAIWPDVKATAIATGSLKQAAEAHGINYAAVKMRASREKWPVGQRVHRQAEAAIEAQKRAIIKTSQGKVTSVTSASEALQNTLEEDAKETKLSASRYARKVMKHAETLPAEQALDVSRKVKDAVDVAAKAQPGWETGKDAPAVEVNFLTQFNVSDSDHING